MIYTRTCIAHFKPALVAQLDARPTSYQEVASSISAGPATFFRGDYREIPIQEAQLSVSAKECPQYWLNA